MASKRSYAVEDIVRRAREAAEEGVCHIELASEDMGAYGVDIGHDVGELLLRLSDALEPYPVMLRTGMTNPPHIMKHLDRAAGLHMCRRSSGLRSIRPILKWKVRCFEVVEALQRPNVYGFMHVPVQSGSDQVLPLAM